MKAIATPKGTLLWPRLMAPDQKFNYYSANIKMTCDEGAELLDIIKQAEQNALKEAQSKARTPKERMSWQIKNHPYVFEEDDDGNRTGNIIFKIKQRGGGVSADGTPWSAKPPAVFNSYGKPIKLKEEFGKGTVAQVSLRMSTYATSTSVGVGVSLNLLGVMVHEEGVTGSPESLGFTVSPSAAADDDGGSYEEEEEGTTNHNQALVEVNTEEDVSPF